MQSYKVTPVLTENILFVYRGNYPQSNRVWRSFLLRLQVMKKLSYLYAIFRLLTWHNTAWKVNIPQRNRILIKSKVWNSSKYGLAGAPHTCLKLLWSLQICLVSDGQPAGGVRTFLLWSNSANHSTTVLPDYNRLFAKFKQRHN